MVSESLLDEIITLLLENWKLISILTSIFAFYYYVTATYDFFKKKGIVYIKPVFVFGSLWPRLAGKVSLHEHVVDVYNHFKGQRYGGVFEGRIPLLYVFDSDLIKHIAIKDFDHFVDHRTIKTDIPRNLTRRLDQLKGKEWSDVRNAVTPVFSSARLKKMLPLIELLTKQMIDYLKVHDKKELELKSAMGRYTLEVLGALAFGVQLKALKDENNPFIKLAEKYDDIPTYKQFLLVFVSTLIPNWTKFLKLHFFNMKSVNGLMRILQASKTEKMSTDIKSTDFLQSFIDIAKNEKSNDGGEKCIMDEDTIDSQCIMFLFAGYDSTSTLLSFALYKLATKPEIQEKLRAHILEVTEGKELTYEVLQDLDYLDGVLLETLRMYPTQARTDRTVTIPYTIPGSNVQLDVGDVVVIPIYAIHMNPDYYPEPHEFRPERFIGQTKTISSQFYMPFGIGQRICVGPRFALLVVKMTMVYLMKNFKVSKCSKTEEPLTFIRRSMTMKTKNGVWVRIEKI